MINPVCLQKLILRKAFQKLNKGIILYSAFPKSASQHLLNILDVTMGNKLNIIRPELSYGFGNNFIAPEKIYGNIMNFYKHLLLYGHFPYHSYNHSVIEKLGSDTKIIVSIRPLPDIVVSYKEHVDVSKSNHGPLDYCIKNLPECNPEWSLLSDKRKYDYIIDFILPWYVRFAVGWAEGMKKWPLIIITFEEHTMYPYDVIPK